MWRSIAIHTEPSKKCVFTKCSTTSTYCTSARCTISLASNHFKPSLGVNTGEAERYHKCMVESLYFSIIHEQDTKESISLFLHSYIDALNTSRLCGWLIKQ